MSYVTHYFVMILLVCTLLYVNRASGVLVYAQVMQSSGYKMQSDSINFAGNRSTSSSYIAEDTLGEVGSGYSSSSNYTLSAGYQQMQEVYIAITSPSDVTLSPTLGGIIGGTSVGNTAVTVTTDNPTGYQLSIMASSSPAMQGSGGGATIADYAPGVDPSYNFSVGAGQAAFAFSPEGADIAQRYKNSGSTCNAGTSDDADKCWDGLSTIEITVAQSTGSNQPSGTQTVLKFSVGVGSNANVVSGIYTATTTVTAVAL